MIESDRPQPQDRNMVENTVHPLANGFQGREAPSIPPPPPFFYRHPYAASDVVTGDETSGDYSPSTSNREDGGSHDDDDGGSTRGSTGDPTDTTSSNRILRFIPNWTHGIFSRGRQKDRESDGLEAFLLELPARTDLESKPSLMKLEMEQNISIRPLLQSCRAAGKEDDRRCGSSTRPSTRAYATKSTLLLHWQSRTWIAIEVMRPSQLDQQESARTVLFFRLGEEVEPVTLNTISGKFTLHMNIAALGR